MRYIIHLKFIEYYNAARAAGLIAQAAFETAKANYIKYKSLGTYQPGQQCIYNIR